MTLSPDGRWLWTGAEWIPAPPAATPDVPEEPVQEPLAVEARLGDWNEPPRCSREAEAQGLGSGFRPRAESVVPLRSDSARRRPGPVLLAVGALGVVGLALAFSQGGDASAPHASAAGGPSFATREAACEVFSRSLVSRQHEWATPDDPFASPRTAFYVRVASETQVLGTEYAELPDLAAAAHAVAEAHAAVSKGAPPATLEEPSRAYRWVCGKNTVAVIGYDPDAKVERTAPSWLPAPAPGTDFSGREG